MSSSAKLYADFYCLSSVVVIPYLVRILCPDLYLDGISIFDQGHCRFRLAKLRCSKVEVSTSQRTMFFSVAAMANNNGYKLLSAQGMETLQTFLRDHGNECIRQFVQVKYALFS